MTKDEAPDYFFCERTLINSLEDKNVSKKFKIRIVLHWQLLGTINKHLI